MTPTREQILSEPAGAQMDAWIAEYWYGWSRSQITADPYYMMPPKGSSGYREGRLYTPRLYSEDIAAAFDLVEKITSNGNDFALFTGVLPGMWTCAFGKLDPKRKRPVVEFTIPLAICRAAMLVKVEE